MTNHEFREKLIKELQKRMPDTDIFPQDTKKNNGVVFSGNHIAILVDDDKPGYLPVVIIRDALDGKLIIGIILPVTPFTFALNVCL